VLKCDEALAICATCQINDDCRGSPNGSRPQQGPTPRPSKRCIGGAVQGWYALDTC